MPKVKVITGKALGSTSSQWIFWCPGCQCLHSFKVPGWTFNGDVEKPTVGPSILVNGNPACYNPTAKRCHSFVKDGRIQFLGDCEHELKGQTVALPDVGEEA